MKPAAAAVAAPWNARLLFEVRGAYAASNADSVNWAPWTMNTTSAGADTAVVVQTVLPTGAAAGSTESLVSLTYEPQPISTDTARNPQSLSMAWIVLQNRFGKFWAPYTQVRMRVLSCTAGASLVAPTIHLDVIGSPL